LETHRVGEIPDGHGANNPVTKLVDVGARDHQCHLSLDKHGELATRKLLKQLLPTSFRDSIAAIERAEDYGLVRRPTEPEYARGQGRGQKVRLISLTQNEGDSPASKGAWSLMSEEQTAR
jgi:hypothetical protein